MERFDQGYYDRFYESKKTRVSGPEEVSHLCAGVVGMIRWFGGEIASVLDVGAGAGLWRDWFKEHLPRVRYRSIEVSDYACRRYGHERRDIVSWRANQAFDLIVCQGVLPYLSDADATRAIDNLGAMAKGFLYLEAITARDLDVVCDRDLTDTTVHARPGSFYRTRLAKHFFQVGCGLYYVKNGALHFYELEQLG
jgi:hypothetical protein